MDNRTTRQQEIQRQAQRQKQAERRKYMRIQQYIRIGAILLALLLAIIALANSCSTRKAIADVDTLAATEAVLNYMKRTSSNASFVLSAKKSFSVDS